VAVSCNEWCPWVTPRHQNRHGHNRIERTTNFYTDPALLDVNGAVNALPDFCDERQESVYKMQ
jgi:hypothetical protein